MISGGFILAFSKIFLKTCVIIWIYCSKYTNETEDLVSSEKRPALLSLSEKEVLSLFFSLLVYSFVSCSVGKQWHKCKWNYLLLGPYPVQNPQCWNIIKILIAFFKKWSSLLAKAKYKPNILLFLIEWIWDSRWKEFQECGLISFLNLELRQKNVPVIWWNGKWWNQPI